jgi:hypothetical protein
MAGRTVAALPLSHFSESILDADRSGLNNQAAAGSLFTTCSYESAESTYGAGDGVPRGAKATVYDTQTEQE